MKLSLSQKNREYYDFWILTQEEQDRFRNYHLPLFTCPSCGNIKNGNWEVNILWNSCVYCWDTESLKEFETSSFQQFQKWEFAFHLDMSIKEHQETIAHFRDFILWQCDQCERHNFNLPKDSQGNPDITQNISCEWCWDPYEQNNDFLSFWAMKWFGFDDGDDSSNTYELKKLWEWQFLWLQAVAKARKIDSHNGDNHHNELSALEEGLKNIKRGTRSISWGRWKDGNRLIYFLESYLDWKWKATTKRVKRETSEYVRAVIDTNRATRRTPYRENAGRLEKYWYKLTHLDQDTIWFTWLWATGIALWLLITAYLVEWDFERTIWEASHRVSLEREDKWILDLQYSLSRREPFYDEEIKYTTVIDTTGRDRFDTYSENRDFYRLQVLWWSQEIHNWYSTLDTWRDEWVDNVCIDIDSWSESSRTYTPSGGWSYWGSNWMWYDGNGGLFHHPEPQDILPEYRDDITYNAPIWDTIISIGGDIFHTLIWVQPAYAGNCGGHYEDITVSAEKFITIQRYSVWDWKEQNWHRSDIISWTNYQTSFDMLQEQILTDNDNQRLIGEELSMFIEVQDTDGTPYNLPVWNEGQWRELSRNIWTQCEISKSYLLSWIYWITADDITEQCIR